MKNFMPKKFQPIEIVNVKYCRGDEVIEFGKIIIKNRKIYFQYNDEFLETKQYHFN